MDYLDSCTGLPLSRMTNPWRLGIGLVIFGLAPMILSMNLVGLM